jgi:putative NIF3 family GTP cyclohydrolase 1 type 2
MKAQDILNYFMEIGDWVDWENTCDAFLHGDPDSDIRAIAVSWIPTHEAIRKAGKQGCNLFISHEPAFYSGKEDTGSAKRLAAEKRRLLDAFGITVLRCHDTWDRMPVHGIPDAWASFLGFQAEERPVESYYKTCHLDIDSVETVAHGILERIKPLGEDSVLIFGDKSRKVSRITVGTGAITNVQDMYDQNPDAILATDDGMNYWTDGLWAEDIDLPIIIVNHAISEIPGMRSLAAYLNSSFPEIQTTYIDIDYRFTTVT